MDLVLREGAFLGETHIVTGAAQGIGFFIAQALARHGAQVALVDIDRSRLERAKAQIEDDVRPMKTSPIVVPADVASESDVSRAVGQVLEATGCINGLVNTAGITRDARITKKSLTDFNLVLSVHLGGTFLFTREVAVQHWHPLFKARGDQPLDDGVNRFIVNFSSVSARNGNVGQVDYTAAKGAIEAVTRTTAREYSNYRVRVNAIAPGPVNTPMLEKIGEQGIAAMRRATLLGKIAEPQDIAATVLGMACPRISGYTTGQIFATNGGMYLA